MIKLVVYKKFMCLQGFDYSGISKQAPIFISSLSLLVIVGKCHNAKYIHNDISTSNVLLHFNLWKVNTVYLGICNWGLPN